MRPVSRWERARSLALTGLAFALPVSIALSNVLWGAALVCWLGLIATDPAARRYRWTGLEIPVLAFLAVELVTGLLSDRPMHSVGKMDSEILWVLFLLYGQSTAQPRRYLGFFFAGAALAAVLGVVQIVLDLPPEMKVLGWTKLVSHAGRAKGFYENPITFAEVLLLAATALLSWIRTDPRGRSFLSWGTLGLLLAGMWFSGTRAIWLAFPAALGLWAIVRRDRAIGGALLAVVLAAGGAMVLSPTYRARAVSVAGVGVDQNANRSNNIRRGVWLECAKLMERHPWTGVGIGNVHIAGRDLRWGGALPDSDWTEAHNIYLQMAVERGLPGLAVFLWLLVALGRLLWRTAREDRFFDGFFFGFLGLVLAGLTESWTNDSEVVMSLYFVLGVAAASRRDRPREKLNKGV